VKHVFHAENPTVLSESLSIGRWPPKWVEGRRIKLTFSDVVRQNSLVLPVGVTDARNQPVKDYFVLIFSRDSARWTANSRYFGNARPDQDGRFKVIGLPAGDFYAIALDYMEQGAGTDPEFLERMRTRATELSLTEDQVRTLDLKIVTGL